MHEKKRAKVELDADELNDGYEEERASSTGPVVVIGLVVLAVCLALGLAAWAVRASGVFGG